MNDEKIVVLSTAPCMEEAEKIASALLESRKAACVSIVPRVISHYRWEGRIQRDEEALLIVKTTASVFDEVLDLVKANHSYDVPEIVALPVRAGNPDYLAWIDDTVSG